MDLRTDSWSLEVLSSARRNIVKISLKISLKKRSGIRDVLNTNLNLKWFRDQLIKLVEQGVIGFSAEARYHQFQLVTLS